MRFIVTTLFLLLVATSTFAQGTNAERAGATARFTKAERELRNMPRDEYRAARDTLARQALAVAENDLNTKDAEELLHWIFSVHHLRLGKTATGLSGTSIDGEKTSLDDYRGRVMLIDFWATWCAPCVTAIPDLKKLRQELDQSKFVIIGVSADTDTTQLRKVMMDREIDWPIIVDSDSVLQKRWQSMSLPSYYVLDEKCVVRYRGDNHHKAATVAKTILGVAPKTQIADVVKGIFALYDTNKDGRIEGAEVPDELKADVKAADQNKDNALSIEELTTFLKGAKVTTEAVSPPNPPSKSRAGTK